MPNWEQVINEIALQQNGLLAQGQIALQQAQAQAAQAVGTIRKKYLQALASKTQRNVIAYYSGFLSKPDLALLDITDEDKNGFMMASHEIDRTKGLDLFLHTPGGRMSATVSIVDYTAQDVWQRHSSNRSTDGDVCGDHDRLLMSRNIHGNTLEPWSNRSAAKRFGSRRSYSGVQTGRERDQKRHDQSCHLAANTKQVLPDLSERMRERDKVVE
jgi:hypothetical protein